MAIRLCNFFVWLEVLLVMKALKDEWYIVVKTHNCDRLRINQPLAANIEFTLREFKVQ